MLFRQYETGERIVLQADCIRFERGTWAIGRPVRGWDHIDRCRMCPARAIDIEFGG